MAFGKKKGDDGQDVQKAPKKKIKKVDIAQNAAYGLLGIVMGLVAAIVVCAMNPALTDMLSEVLQSGKEVEEPESTAPVYAWNSNSGTSASFSLENTEENQVPNTENATVPESDGEGSINSATVTSDDVGEADGSEGEDAAAAETEEVTPEETTGDIAEETSGDAKAEIAEGAAATSDGEAAEAPSESVDSSDANTGDSSDTENAGTDDTTAATTTEIVPLVSIATAGEAEADAAQEETEEVSEYTPAVVTGKSAYVELTPDVIEVSENQAKQISNNVGYGNTGEGLDFNEDFYPYYNMLDDDLKSLYRQIYANAMTYNKAFKPIVQASMSDIENVVSSVSYDHPELFWLDTTFYTEYDYNGEAVKIVLSFYDRLGDLSAARSEFEAAAENMISGAQGLSSDYEKELYVHNLLADKLTYKHNSLDQSAYSGIVMDYTVCAGYAKAFQYLMQKLGIPTYLCVGAGASELHAWNIIRLDGEYYNVDCTWDDQDPTTYDYFNLSDRMNYMHTRMYQSVNLPACTKEPTLIIAY